MTVLVTGAAGQLGRALRPLLPEAQFADADQLDITDRAAVDSRVRAGVSAIVNAAAFTAVDAAEDPARLPRVFDVNVLGVANLAMAARRHEIALLHVSTDYVLSGEHRGDAPMTAALDPSGAYGITKAAAELAARLAPRHHIIRTSWLFGDGPNFVRTMRRLASERTELSVVADQVGRPTYAVDLARALLGLLYSTDYGTHHATGAGPVVSWADFARAVLADTPVGVRDISTAEFGAPAARPANSALAADLPMRDWRTALADYLEGER